MVEAPGFTSLGPTWPFPFPFAAAVETDDSGVGDLVLAEHLVGWVTGLVDRPVVAAAGGASGS
jgi:hypothetical protein